MERNFAIKFTKILLDKLNSYEFLNSSRVSKKHFTRNRKLSFSNIMLLIIRGLIKNLQTELREYMFNVLKQDKTCSKQAFSKAGQHIKPSAFRELFDLSVSSFYQNTEYKALKGYRVLAVDGSKLNLPNSAELIEKYGVQTSQGAPQAQALLSALYDVLNNIILDAELVPCRSGEGKSAQQHINWLSKNSCNNKEIIIFDRGYVEVDILSGKEFLITNLPEDEFNAQELKELYHLRWKIESEYDNLKNKILLENFSGTCDIAILQDLYASLLLSNYAYFFVYDNEGEIANMNLSKERKYDYKQNINQTILSLRTILINAISTGSIHRIQKAVELIEKDLKRAVIPIKEGRNFPRTRKHTASKFPINKR